MKDTLAPLAFLLSLALAACESAPTMTDFPAAQQLVKSVQAAHSDLVRLTIHAVPTGGEKCQVIASTSADKLGQWSDQEDLDAMKTGEPIEMMEGADLDYTAPVKDAMGEVVAVVGVTVSGSDATAQKQSAQAIADEVSKAILGATAAMW
ncbi:MAG: hypothetical protein IPM29_21430 [Planctomycetes bacterium]|nr:hypothetical protein [Planctomycetota bacterium]